MPKLVIEGGKSLKGEIKLQGAKNSVLPILVATILSEEESVIHGCPNLSDVAITVEILNFLGCKTKFEGESLIINPKSINKNKIPEMYMRKMRSSIIFLGALISRMGCAEISLPGGCELGPRPLDLHFSGLRQLGMISEESHGKIRCNIGRGLVGSNIVLSFPSVGATENLILSAVKAKGETIITNAAREPEIQDLANYLNKCGAKIRGAGEGTIRIEGVDKLHGAHYSIIPDRIAAITYMAATAVTSGDILINRVYPEHLSSVIPIFEECGCIIEIFDKGKLRLIAPERLLSNAVIRTMPYPGFPTDAQPPIMTMLCAAEGSSIIIENIFESRYKHVGELLRLGADIKVEGRTAIVNGVKRLSGADVRAEDLRGAAALVVAGLCAEGTTKISGLRHIDRGYEDIEGNLCKIGANIKRI